MAPKQQLDKVAWQWAETTDADDVTQDHIEAVYRIHLKACKPTVCRRNCRGNPNCLNCLGERDWFHRIEDSSWHDVEDPELERREKGSFVGLKNLGATCYVNTFIQVWFHNSVFRDAVFAWKGDDVAISKASGPLVESLLPAASQLSPKLKTVVDASAETKPESTEKPLFGPEPQRSQMQMAPDKDLMPKTVCGHLQLIFGLLQFSNRRYIDPSSFIHCLGLDTAQQQDAQEFSKLFMSVLEDQLSQDKATSELMSSEAPTPNLIRDQFQGEYAYVTTFFKEPETTKPASIIRCSACSGVSQRTSGFYELDLNIKGHSNLSECIQEFLQEEKLENDNQYMCGICNKKQNASRRIQLKRLPRVLNFQLLRFVFDRKTGHKKKLNTFIQFPEVLDLSQHVGKAAHTLVYNLVAVLIHCGPSAYSGHYVAHVKDTKSQSWYKFNDEEIERMEGKNLQLGNEEELGVSVGMDGKCAKRPKVAKGSHSSRNAYMLVYVRKEKVPEPPKPVILESLPERLQLNIEMDRRAFGDWVREMKTMRDANVASGRQRQSEIRHIFRLLPTTPGMDYDWIETRWLTKWLAENTARKVPVIDNAHLCCSHGKISPDGITKLKIISAEAAASLYAKYSGGPRLSGAAMMCRDCVVECCRVIRTKARVAEDQKLIAAALKANAKPCEDSYWVGKMSLRSWKRLVLENMEDNENANGDGNPKENAHVAMNGCGKDVAEGKSEEEADEARFGFNDDIVCEQHNQLVVKEGCRLLLMGDAWRRLRSYFPEAPEFKFGTEPCTNCRKELEETEATLELTKARTQEQKVALYDLYMDKNRPTWCSDATALNLVPRQFLDTWRKYLREPTRHLAVTSLSNASFLCPHGGFMHEPETIGLTPSSKSLVYVWPHEWTELQRLMKTDLEVRIGRNVEETGHVTFITMPDICSDCQQSRKEAERLARLSFKNAVIFVRKVSSDSKHSTGGSSNTASEPPDKNDPEFCSLQQNGKRKKLESELCSASQEKHARHENNARRSSRHRKVRGEKELTVSATTTLWDVKIKLMKEYSSPPMDQHLYLSDTQLVGDQRTLGDLGVTPSSVLYLRIDEPCEDPMLMDDAMKAGKPEEGFKGTGLLRGTLTT